MDYSKNSNVYATNFELNEATKDNETDLENNNVDNKEIQINKPDLSTDVTNDCEEIENYTEEDFPLKQIVHNKFSLTICKIRSRIIKGIKAISHAIKITIISIIVLLLIAYFIWFVICKSRKGTIFKVEDNIRLIWLTCLFYCFLVYHLIKYIRHRCRGKCNVTCRLPIWWDKFTRILFYIICTVLAILIATHVIYYAVKNDASNLVSLAGLVILLVICFLFSTAPHVINWRTVFVGLLMQCILGWFVMTTDLGNTIAMFIANGATMFLNHAAAGSEFVFGKVYAEHLFAFKIMPIIVFIGSLTSMLYYLNVIQAIVIILGTIMQWLLETTCGESMCAVGNIFLGSTESVLLVKPLLKKFTNSELHAVMTSGLSTIAGSVLGAFIIMGASSFHVITATILSSPASLVVAKLLYPETRISKTSKKDVNKLPKSPHHNLIEAAASGAVDSVKLVVSVVSTILAFVSLLDVINKSLLWLGNRACLSIPLSFELICSFVLWPVSLLMGVEINDCRKVAGLIGIKLFLTELISYEKLGKLIRNKHLLNTINKSIVNVTYTFNDIILTLPNGTVTVLEGGILESEKSTAIATYAMCGFANFVVMGVSLSALITILPHRRKDLSGLILRALFGANIACFMTASVAGLFYKPTEN